MEEEKTVYYPIIIPINDGDFSFLHFNNTIPPKPSLNVIKKLRGNKDTKFLIYEDRIIFIDTKNKIFNVPSEFLIHFYEIIEKTKCEIPVYSYSFRYVEGFLGALNNPFIGKNLEENVNLDLIPNTCVCETHRWLTDCANDEILKDKSINFEMSINMNSYSRKMDTSFARLLKGHQKQHTKEINDICNSVRLLILQAHTFQENNIWYMIPKDILKIIFSIYLKMTLDSHSLIFEKKYNFYGDILTLYYDEYHDVDYMILSDKIEHRLPDDYAKKLCGTRLCGGCHEYYGYVDLREKKFEIYVSQEQDDISENEWKLEDFCGIIYDRNLDIIDEDFTYLFNLYKNYKNNN